MSAGRWPLAVSLSADIEYRPDRPEPYRARVRWIDPATKHQKPKPHARSSQQAALDWIEVIRRVAQARIDPETASMSLAASKIWGGAGIGEALCRELARRGARVVVADINGDDADRVTTALAGDGGRAQAGRVDVADEQDVRRLVEETAAAHGRLDYLFNNAGIAIGVTPGT